MGYLTAANIDGSDYKLASGLFGTCTTPASTAAKVVTCTDFDSLDEGVTIHVKFTNAQSAASPTLNVNSTGAKSITGGGSWSAGSVCSFTYDGTNWIRNDGYFVDTKNTAGSTNNSTDPLYLIGATSQGANPQTYSNSKVYATNGALVADSFNGVQLKTSGITPSGVRIGTSTTYITIPAGMAGTLAAAAGKGVDTSIASGSTSTNLPTTAAVADYVDSAVATATAGGLSYHGTASALTDITNTNYKKGWYWVADDSFSWTKTTGSVTETIYVDPGDMIIAHQDKTSTVGDDLDAVQSNIVALTTAEIDADWAAA